MSRADPGRYTTIETEDLILTTHGIAERDDNYYAAIKYYRGGEIRIWTYAFAE